MLQDQGTEVDEEAWADRRKLDNSPCERILSAINNPTADVFNCNRESFKIFEPGFGENVSN